MYQHITDQWLAGAPAPYALFDVDGRLVEAVGDGRAPVISAGEAVCEELSARILAQHNPPAQPPVAIHQLVLGADGQPTFDKKGNIITEEVMEAPPDGVVPMTYVIPQPVAVPTCDQCGNPRDQLYPIGIGMYCKVERDVHGQQRTCYDVRVAEMLAK